MKMRSEVNLWADGMISGGRMWVPGADETWQTAFDEWSLCAREERRIRRSGRGHIWRPLFMIFASGKEFFTCRSFAAAAGQPISAPVPNCDPDGQPESNRHLDGAQF